MRTPKVKAIKIKPLKLTLGKSPKKAAQQEVDPIGLSSFGRRRKSKMKGI